MRFRLMKGNPPGSKRGARNGSSGGFILGNSSSNDSPVGAMASADHADDATAGGGATQQQYPVDLARLVAVMQRELSQMKGDNGRLSHKVDTLNMTVERHEGVIAMLMRKVDASSDSNSNSSARDQVYSEETATKAVYVGVASRANESREETVLDNDVPTTCQMGIKTTDAATVAALDKETFHVINKARRATLLSMDTKSNQTMDKYPFIRWGTNTNNPPAGKFTGVITYRRTDGSRVAEREFYNGSTWGTCRYFNSNDRFVGQELYGKLGYDPNNSGLWMGGAVCHRAWVNQTEFTRIRNEYNGNSKAFFEVFCEYSKMSARQPWCISTKTGVDTCLRTNGTTIVERELGGGAVWGCHRYYDEKKRLVGQEYCGSPLNVNGPGNRARANPIDTDLDHFIPIPRGPSDSLYNKKKKFESCKAEFYSPHVSTLFGHIFAANEVGSNEDFVNMLCNINDIAIRASKNTDVGEVPDDIDKQCNLLFFVLREHSSQWSTNRNIATALERDV